MQLRSFLTLRWNQNGSKNINDKHFAPTLSRPIGLLLIYFCVFCGKIETVITGSKDHCVWTKKSLDCLMETTAINIQTVVDGLPEALAVQICMSVIWKHDKKYTKILIFHETKIPLTVLGTFLIWHNLLFMPIIVKVMSFYTMNYCFNVMFNISCIFLDYSFEMRHRT